MSLNRGTSRRGNSRNRGYTRTYERRRRSGWGNNARSPYNQSSNSDREEGITTKRNAPSIFTGSNKNSNRRRGFSFRDIDVKTWLIIAGGIGLILAIVLIVSYFQTNGEVLNTIGQSVTQFCTNLLIMLAITTVVWAIVAFTLFRWTSGRVKAILYIIVFFLVLMATFNNTIGITIIVLLVIGSLLAFFILK